MELGDRYGQIHALEGLAALAAGTDPERAATLFAAAEKRRSALDMPLPPDEAQARETLVRECAYPPG